jgi:glutamine cyclotransferase
MLSDSNKIGQNNLIIKQANDMDNRLLSKLMISLLAIMITLVALYCTSSKVMSPVRHDNATSSIVSPLTVTATGLATPTQTSAPITNSQSQTKALLSPLQSPVISVTANAVAAHLLTQTLTQTVGVATLVPANIITYTYSIVNTYPHDPKAFTEGLLFDNGSLYESTGLNGKSWLRKVDLATGKVLQQVDLSEQYFGEGISIFGDKLYQLTWKSYIGFVYNKTTFELFQTFPYNTEGWGMTQDGTHLIMSDGTARLTLRDPKTFEEIGHIDVHDANRPITRLNELEYIRGEIYANIWMTDQIVMISPQTGQVTGWIDLTGLLPPAERAGADVLNGIAYLPQNDRLFVTGKQWPKLFEIRLVPKA